LLLGKPPLFLFFQCTYCLHRCGPVMIDAINCILGLIVCIPIDLIVNQWITYCLLQTWRIPENIGECWCQCGNLPCWRKSDKSI
jgi:hypothetical protein